MIYSFSRINYHEFVTYRDSWISTMQAPSSGRPAYSSKLSILRLLWFFSAPISTNQFDKCLFHKKSGPKFDCLTYVTPIILIKQKFKSTKAEVVVDNPEGKFIDMLRTEFTHLFEKFALNIFLYWRNQRTTFAGTFLLNVTSSVPTPLLTYNMAEKRVLSLVDIRCLGKSQ